MTKLGWCLIQKINLLFCLKQVVKHELYFLQAFIGQFVVFSNDYLTTHDPNKKNSFPELRPPSCLLDPLQFPESTGIKCMSHMVNEKPNVECSMVGSRVILAPS